MTQGVGVARADRIVWRIVGAEDVNAIAAFVEELTSRLSRTTRFTDGTIPLALSHGDFFSGNVILAPDGPPPIGPPAALARRSTTCTT